MIVSFTGAQSTGKTTLLKRLKDSNPNVSFVDEVTRRIKRDFDLPINEDGGDLTQYMIMADHIGNLYRKNQSELTILDRCALDGVVYTGWLQQQAMVSPSTYTNACLIYSQIIDKYDVIFYTDPTDVKLVDDGERSIDEGFRNDIISLFNDRIKQLDNVVVLQGSVNDRLNKIKKTFEKYNLDINI